MENELVNILKTRKSVRNYDPDRIPPQDAIDKIIEAGTFAPTGRGSQSPVIIAVTNKEVRDKLSKINAEVLGTTSDPFYGAPVVLIVLANRDIPTYLYDGSLVMGNLMNAAHALGLGSCWIHRAKEIFDMSEWKDALKEWGVVGNYEGIGHCVIGYSREKDVPRKPRKPDYVHYVK